MSINTSMKFEEKLSNDPQNYDEQKYFNTIDKLADRSFQPMVDDHGEILQAQMFRRFWEHVKGFFGGVDHTSTKWVELRFTTLLKYGEKKDWKIDPERIKKIKTIARNIGLDEGNPESIKEHKELNTVIQTVLQKTAQSIQVVVEKMPENIIPEQKQLENFEDKPQENQQGFVNDHAVTVISPEDLQTFVKATVNDEDFEILLETPVEQDSPKEQENKDKPFFDQPKSIPIIENHNENISFSLPQPSTANKEKETRSQFPETPLKTIEKPKEIEKPDLLYLSSLLNTLKPISPLVAFSNIVIKGSRISKGLSAWVMDFIQLPKEFQQDNQKNYLKKLDDLDKVGFANAMSVLCAAYQVSLKWLSRKIEPDEKKSLEEIQIAIVDKLSNLISSNLKEYSKLASRLPFKFKDDSSINSEFRNQCEVNYEKALKEKTEAGNPYLWKTAAVIMVLFGSYAIGRTVWPASTGGDISNLIVPIGGLKVQPPLTNTLGQHTINVMPDVAPTSLPLTQSSPAQNPKPTTKTQSDTIKTPSKEIEQKNVKLPTTEKVKLPTTEKVKLPTTEKVKLPTTEKEKLTYFDQAVERDDYEMLRQAAKIVEDCGFNCYEDATIWHGRAALCAERKGMSSPYSQEFVKAIKSNSKILDLVSSKDKHERILFKMDKSDVDLDNVMIANMYEAEGNFDKALEWYSEYLIKLYKNSHPSSGELYNFYHMWSKGKGQIPMQMYHLAKMYENGGVIYKSKGYFGFGGVSIDKEKALKWYQAAKAKGCEYTDDAIRRLS